MKSLILIFTLLFTITHIFSNNFFVAQDTCKIVIKKQVAAVYPKEALEKDIEGTVFVAIEIGKDGFVQTAMVTKTDNEILNEAALNAVIKWEFKPLKECQKVTIPIKFKLTK